MDAFAMADMMETFSDNGVFQEQLDLENPYKIIKCLFTNR